MRDQNKWQEAINRRKFLQLGAVAALGTVIVPQGTGSAMAAIFRNGSKGRNGSRRVAFRNAHTNESFSGVYRVGDKYLPDAFDQINIVMRDFRTDEVFPMDPRVLDIMYTVHKMTGHDGPFEVLSGYRSPRTNAMLRRASSGVAKKSLHMTGQAVDLRLPGFSTRKVRDIARTLKAGGVGFYPGSDFVHMDTGDVRSW